VSRPSDLIPAFRAVVAAAWPEVVPNGIWDAREAIVRSYEQNFAFPYAVIDIPGLPSSDRDGITNRAWRGPFAIYYVGETDGDFTALDAKMNALADALEAPLAAGQIIPPNVSLASGRDIEANALLILLNATQRAGQVAGTVAAGEQR
jgi:hypothetical protein